MRQLEHHEVKNSIPHEELILWVDTIHSPENIAGIFRTAEAMGITQIYWYKPHLDFFEKKIVRGSRNTSNTIQSIKVASTETLSLLKSQGFSIVALEITDKSTSIYNYLSHNKAIILVGNESKGLSEELLNLADTSYHIPMYGKNTSINVVVALGIALSTIRESKYIKR